MTKAEAIWKAKRGSKAARQSLYERLDYQRELTRQDPSQRHLVVYNAAGTNVSASRFDRLAYPLCLIVEHKLYWSAVADEAEADYLVAVLNSDAANDDSAGQVHRKIAELGEKARQDAAAIVKSPGFPAATSLARQRAFVRQNVKATLSEIDRLVRQIL